MSPAFHFTYERDWRTAPLAFWVHVPVAGSASLCVPPAPEPVPHRGYLVLRVQFERHELQFSSLAQLDHFIQVLSSKPLPTSRQLSARRGLPVGPNGHWLSRLPADLKAPRKREKLVHNLKAVRVSALAQTPNPSIERTCSSGLRPLPHAAHVKR
jgi:hypothetical protein